MHVTIIADASHCPDTKKAGYGFWIASQRGKRGGDGVFRGLVVNNIAAEMMALLNGLKFAHDKCLVLDNDAVLLQTDCQAAIDAFNGDRKSLTLTEKQLVNWFRTFCSDYGLSYRFKHVKGHTRNKDARYVVNNICDRKAKKNMRFARDKHLEEIGETV